MPYLPVFIEIDVAPVTKVATVTAISNALALGSLKALPGPSYVPVTGA